MNTGRSIQRTLAPLLLALLASVLLLSAVPVNARTSRVAEGPTALPSRPEPDFAAIDAFVESEMQALRVPGLALAIVQGDRIVHLKGFGHADTSGRPVTPQTPFGIGSVNKPLIAMAAMQLVEAGKIELDAPVQRYLRWFRVADEAASAQITVRHLLEGTSGIPELAGYEDIASGYVADDALERQVRKLSTAALAHPVGSTWGYCNVCFSTLAVLIQQVSGQTFEAYLQQHVFAPLEMHQTFSSLVDAQQHGIASGYRSWFGVQVPITMPHNRGSAYIYSSVEDQAHFLIAQLNAGRYGSASVLSPAGIATMQRPAAPDGDSGTFWGMGWAIGKGYYGIPVLAKNGDHPNFHADVALIPEGRWGIVLLTNGKRVLHEALGDRSTSGIANGVANRLVGQEAPIYRSKLPLLIYSVLVLTVVLQLGGMLWSVRTLRRWHTQPARRPRGPWSVGWRIGLPLALNLALGAGFLLGLSTFFGGIPLSALMVVVPDLGYTSLIGGVVAIGWGIMYTVLALAILQPQRSTRSATTPLPA